MSQQYITLVIDTKVSHISSTTEHTNFTQCDDEVCFVPSTVGTFF